MHTHPTPDAIPHRSSRAPPFATDPGGPHVRVAFIARVSTDDWQDPTLSLPRQLTNCQAALPEGWEITVLFWAIESGRVAPDRHGRGHAHEHINVPIHHDGGLADLLAESEYPGRRFDVVICESIDRLATSWRVRACPGHGALPRRRLARANAGLPEIADQIPQIAAASRQTGFRLNG